MCYAYHVGAIPQHDNSLAHDFAAGVYFLSAVIWMGMHSVTTFLLAEHHNGTKSAQHISQRRVAYFRTFLTVFAFIAALVMQILVDNSRAPVARATSATLEILMTASWLVYIATFFSDFSRVDVKFFHVDSVKTDSCQERLLLSHS